MARATATPPGPAATGSGAASARPEIGLADLAQAYVYLTPIDPAVGEAIAALLGLHQADWRLAAVLQPAPGTPEIATEVGDATEITPDDLGDEEARPAHTTRRQLPPTAAPIRFTIDRLQDVEAEPEPAWLSKVDLDSRTPVSALPALPLQTLIPPGYIRSTMARLLATPVPEGAVAVPRLVDLIARGEPVKAIPRAPVPSLRQGVQLLVDVSPSLAPFSEDQGSLLRDIDDLVGPDNLNLYWFEGNPLDGVFGPDDDYPRPYEPPAPGAMVFLLTDLGIGSPTAVKARASTAGWRRFAALVGEADAHLLAMVPYAPWRWPPALRAVVPMIQWEQASTASRPVPRVAAALSPPLQALARRNPQALELAKAVSLAARIERALLRAARLELLPEADAGAEADVWLSSLVQTRSVGSLLMRAEIAQELRRLLARDGSEAVERAWAFLDGYRRRDGSSYDIRQEERLYYLSAHPEKEESAEGQVLLQESLAALIRGGDANLDIGRWALRAIPRLPRSLRTLPVAAEIYYAAAVRLGVLPADESVLPGDMSSVRWLQPKATGTTELGVQLVEGGLKFSRQLLPDMAPLQVTEATPVLLDVTWPGVTGPERQQVLVPPSGTTTLHATTCQLVGVSRDGSVRRWQVADGREIQRYSGDSGTYQSVAVSPSAHAVAAGGWHSRITLWDLESGQQRWQVEADETGPVAKSTATLEGVLALAFSPDGRTLATTNAAGEVTLWHAGSGTRRQLIPAQDGLITTMTFDRQSGHLVAATTGGTAAMWDIVEGSVVWGAHDEGAGVIHAVAVSRDGRLLATGGVDERLRLWDIEKRAMVQVHDLVAAPVYDLAFDPSGTKLAVAAEGGLVVWDIGENRLVEPEEELAPCVSLTYSPDGHHLFATDGDGRIHMLETAFLEEQSAFTAAKEPITRLVAFNPPAATFTVQTDEGRQYEIAPDRRPLAFPPRFTFEHLIDARRRSQHPEVESALRKIDEWLAFPPARPVLPWRAFVVTGGPASGKNTLASTLIAISRGEPSVTSGWDHLGPDILAAHYFVDPSQADTADARSFVISLAQQLAQRLPEYGERLYALARREGLIPPEPPGTDPFQPQTIRLDTQQWQSELAAPLLRKYLVEPLAALAEEDRFEELLILVGDLHHAADATLAPSEALPALLPALDELPPGVHFIFTTRPLPQVMSQLERLDPERFTLAPDAQAEGKLDVAAERQKMHALLAQTFNLEELGTLSFFLDVDYDALPGSTREQKVVGLLDTMEKTGRMGDLLAAVKEERPHVRWPEGVSERPDEAAPAAPERLEWTRYRKEMHQLMVDAFSLDELQELCLYLELDYEDLPGQTRNAKVRELLLFAERHGRLDELEQIVRSRGPNLPWPKRPPSPREKAPPPLPAEERLRYRTAIRELLEDTFTQEELRTLTFLLDVPYEDLAGSTKAERIQELISSMEDSGRLADLEAEARRQRPRAPWPVDVVTPGDGSSATRQQVRERMSYRAELYGQMTAAFNVNDLRLLCSDLQADYEDFAGAGKSDKVRELILFMERQGRLDELEAVLRERRPDRTWPVRATTPGDEPSAAGTRYPAQFHFVNRERELAQFEEMIEQGRKRILLVRGEPGMGKTALLQAMSRRLEWIPESRFAFIALAEMAPPTELSLLRRLARELSGNESFPSLSAVLEDYQMEPSSEAQAGASESASLPEREPDARQAVYMADAFLHDLEALAARAQQIAIFLDGFERAPERVRSLITEVMLPWVERVRNLVFVIATREEPAVPRRQIPLTESLMLQPLDVGAIKEYLLRRGVTGEDEAFIDKLVAATEGRPDELFHLTESLLRRQDQA